jgi:hypothetical protein
MIKTNQKIIKVTYGKLKKNNTKQTILYIPFLEMSKIKEIQLSYAQ